jgi:hypothetical protein
MDTWLTSHDVARRAQRRAHAQIVAGKPGDGVRLLLPDRGHDVLDKITASRRATPTQAEANSSPRQVAGGPLVENIMKCQPSRSTPPTTRRSPSRPRSGRLLAAAACRDCDWSKPGVGQQEAISPLTFAAGAGGVPLPPPPTQQNRVR